MSVWIGINNHSFSHSCIYSTELGSIIRWYLYYFRIHILFHLLWYCPHSFLDFSNGGSWYRIFRPTLLHQIEQFSTAITTVHFWSTRGRFCWLYSSDNLWKNTIIKVVRFVLSSEPSYRRCCFKLMRSPGYKDYSRVTLPVSEGLKIASYVTSDHFNCN